MTEKWDTADIADYMGITREHVTSKIVKESYFPAPVINRGRIRRWDADSVRRWASGQSLEAIGSEVAR